MNTGKHKIWRKDAKKQRRKKIRQKLAIEREKIQSSSITNKSLDLTLLAKQRFFELTAAEEADRIQEENNRKWLEREAEAQKKFNELKRKQEQIERNQELERARIKAEFDAEKKKRQDLAAAKRRALDEEQQQIKLLLQKLDEYVAGIGEIPEEMTVAAQTNPGRDICPFFVKTASCRFGDRCSRNHSRPGVSKLLLVPNFFTSIALEQTKKSEYGSDLALEIEETELVDKFKEFFNDVIPEFELFGKLQQFRVCRNFLPHLRGNTYIDYEHQRNAVKAYQAMQGRYYAGRRINIEFCSIVSWKAAVCGLFSKNKCPKGSACNFLHVFKNPNNQFPLADYQRSQEPSMDFNSQQSIIQKRQNTHKSWDEMDYSPSVRRNWRWSETPELDNHKSEPSQAKDQRLSSERSTRSSRSTRRHRSPKSEEKESDHRGAGKRRHKHSSSSSSTCKRYSSSKYKQKDDERQRKKYETDKKSKTRSIPGR